MPKRKLQGSGRPRRGSRSSVRRTAEFITQQWLLQLSDDWAPARPMPPKVLKGAGRATMPSAAKVALLSLVVLTLALPGRGSSASSTSS